MCQPYYKLWLILLLLVGFSPQNVVADNSAAIPPCAELLTQMAAVDTALETLSRNDEPMSYHEVLRLRRRLESQVLRIPGSNQFGVEALRNWVEHGLSDNDPTGGESVFIGVETNRKLSYMAKLLDVRPRHLVYRALEHTENMVARLDGEALEENRTEFTAWHFRPLPQHALGTTTISVPTAKLNQLVGALNLVGSRGDARKLLNLRLVNYAVERLFEDCGFSFPPAWPRPVYGTF